jgi:phospholipase/carboxylesterase
MRIFILVFLVAFIGPQIGLAGHGRFTVRSEPRVEAPTPTGHFTVKVTFGSDLHLGNLYIPQTYTAQKAAPLLVAFHGANGMGRVMTDRLVSLADQYGIILFAPQSKAYTWDLIKTESFESDSDFIERSLNYIINTYSINRDRVAALGHSDGASYALSLGLINGDIFKAIFAFAPGFVVRQQAFNGSSQVLIAHGSQDQILPLSCSRDRIVPALTEMKVPVTYLEFDGDHYWAGFEKAGLIHDAIASWMSRQ